MNEQAQQDFIRMICAAAIGDTIPEIPDKLTWEQYIDTASQHQCSALLAQAAQAKHSGCPKEELDVLSKQRKLILQTTALRDTIIVDLLHQMVQDGFHPVLLKGLDIAQYYAVPELRECTDTDFWIPGSEEKGAMQWFAQHGGKVYPREANMQHFAVAHPDCGILEIHVAFFRSYDTDLWIRYSEFDVLSNVCYTMTSYGKIPVLEPTVSFSYLCLHFLNHFLLSGVNLRQCLDLYCYARANRNRIDWSAVQKILERNRAERLIAAVLNLFGTDTFPLSGSSSPEAEQAVREDLFAEEHTRKLLHTQNAKEAQGKEGTQYLFRYYCKRLIQFCVPGKNYLKRSYPDKSLPFAYAAHWKRLFQDRAQAQKARACLSDDVLYRNRSLMQTLGIWKNEHEN